MTLGTATLASTLVAFVTARLSDEAESGGAGCIPTRASYESFEKKRKEVEVEAVVGKDGGGRCADSLR
eukprot:717241-Pleurochrysis_carterae.AAC.3